MAVVNSGLNWKGEECSFYMDNNLLKNLTPVKEVVVKKDFDFVLLITGRPGIGKSNLAISICKFLDPNFTENNICFGAEDWKKKTLELPKFSAIMLDESFADFNSRRSGSEEFLDILNHLQIVRQKNHFLIFVLPSFFDLHKSLAIYRSSFLFECYGKNFGERGTFKAFDRNAKKMLYLKGKKFLDENASKPNFIGRFTRQTAIREQVYTDLKAKHLRENADNIKNKPSLKAKVERDRLIAYMKLILDYNANKIEEISGVSRKTVYNSVNSQRDNILEQFKEDETSQ